MPEDRAPDATRRSDRARRAILTAAVDLVTELGYAKLTVESIAARAGVGKQTIYRWWPSKGAVVFDALLALSEGADGIALPDTGDLAADLKLVLTATVAEFGDPRLDLLYRALTTEIQYDPALAAGLVERLLGPLLEATKDRLRSAQDSGQIATDLDLGIAVELIYGPVYHRWLLRTAPLTPEYAEAVVDLAITAMNGGS